MFIKSNVVLFCCLLFSMLTAGQAKKPFQISDYTKLATLSDPQFSPDGSYLSLVVSKPDLEKNHFIPAIAQVDVHSGKEEWLVSNFESISQPRYSPDSRYLSFVAKASPDSGGKLQIFILSLQDKKEIGRAHV